MNDELKIVGLAETVCGKASALAFAATVALFALQTIAAPLVTNVDVAQQEWPDTDVDIYYDLFDAEGSSNTVNVAISEDGGWIYNVQATNFSGDIGYPVLPGEYKHIVWHAGADYPGREEYAMRVRIVAENVSAANLYMVVDLSGGPNAASYPISYLSAPPPKTDEYKKTKILLRKISKGTYLMGSPVYERFRGSDETQHQVTFTKDFYMGVYEMTQAQYSNVMNLSPSTFNRGVHAPKRPVSNVTWTTVRGGTWNPGGAPSASSCIGKLRAKTGRTFDLPTEAQWEYACRAGTLTMLNNGTDVEDYYWDPKLDLLGRYWENGGYMCILPYTNSVVGAHAEVGIYLPNQWGLYDMHGNIFEWCLDWYASNYGNSGYGPVTDPSGPLKTETSERHMLRGRSFMDDAGFCRSAERMSNPASYTYHDIGFRLCLTL